MKPISNDKETTVKAKRIAIPASAILPAPVEKGQIISLTDAIVQVAKPVAVKAASPVKAKTAAPRKTAAPAKTAASAKTVSTPVAAKPTQAAVAKSKPAARTAKHVLKEKTATPQKAAKNKDAKKKSKVVRDSFTMPEGDYAKLAALKARCLAAGVHVKKSELLRAGLQVLETLPAKKLLAIIAGVENVKTGRPAKS